jgi:hypothetical protein
MPATRTAASRSRTASASTKKASAQKSAAERCEQNSRAIARIAKSLEVAQADLAALRGSVGTGATDLRKDVMRLLRDARRDLTKMSKAVSRDLERAQRDLASAAKSAVPKSPRSRGGAPAAKRKSRSRGAGS